MIYATSNRRHLIVERFSDHDAPDEGEIHSMDTVQEKLSSPIASAYAYFSSPRTSSATSRSCADWPISEVWPIAPEDLERRALQWATWQNGRSGRTARQFIDHLSGALARERRG